MDSDTEDSLKELIVYNDEPQMLHGGNSSALELERLGYCEVCAAKPARYTCPKCEVKTCCLTCVNIHKKELECDGIRDRTKFIPINDMTEADFKSDYYFLAECGRYLADRKQDRFKRLTFQKKNLPRNLFKLRKACSDRNIKLKILMPHFTRRKENSSYLNWKLKKISWHVDWIFVNADNLKYTDDKCDEDVPLYELLEKYFKSDSAENIPKRDLLVSYQSCDIFDLKILLKAEGVKRSNCRYYLLDIRKSLKTNLNGKTIVEYPIIYVTYNTNLEGFEVIDSDDDVEAETKSHEESLNMFRKTLIEKQKANIESKDQISDEEEDNIEEKLAELKRQERKRKLEEYENTSSNFLFTDDNLIDALISSSDSEA